MKDVTVLVQSFGASGIQPGEIIYRVVEGERAGWQGGREEGGRGRV